MPFIYILLIFTLLVLILASLLYLIYHSTQTKPSDLNPAVNTLLNVAEKQLGDKTNSVRDMVQKVMEELTKSQDKLKLAEDARINNFATLSKAIENNQHLTEQLKVTADSLNKVLTNNQTRGAFGEEVAENLLKHSGFTIGTDYTKQETMGESRPDFTVYLPDKTKINVDSKFPLSSFKKMIDTNDTTQKEQYKKLFEQDVRKKISDVTGRSYINPEENTVDFVIIFIPNEMIFSFIYEQFSNLMEEAFNKKIVFAGPFSFTAILRMVRQAYDNFRFQKNVQGIITQIKIFGTEFEKYNEEFVKIGDRIDSLHKQYDEVNNTRSKKLQKVVDRISIEAPPEALHE